MSIALVAVIVLVTIVGSVAQRMAGLGFALLVSPLMTLLLGAHSGVMLVNVLGMSSSLLILPRVWRQIDWSIFRWLTIPAIVGSVLGAWFGASLSPDVMALTVGAIVLVAMLVSGMFTSERFTTDLKAPRGIAGFISGLTSALAGVGGPAVSAYAVMTRWPQQSFAATLQPFFVVTAATSAGSKMLLDPSTFPETDWWFWAALLAAMLAGIAIGEQLLRKVTPKQVRRAVVVIACLGAAATMVRGAFGL